MGMSVLPASIYVHLYIPSSCIGQKRALDLLQLGLQVVVAYPTWVLGNQPSSSARTARALNS